MLTLKGIQEAQRWNLRAINAMSPSGAFGSGVRTVMVALHRYAVTITHVWRVKGGGLRASHRMQYDDGRLRGRIYIDDSSVNPRGGRPAAYGPIEEARGGSHQFYGRTVREEAPRVGSRVAAMIARSAQ